MAAASSHLGRAPAFLREGAALWPGILAKLEEQAGKDAESWEKAFGRVIPVDAEVPVEKVALKWPLERAEEVAAALDAELGRFWEALPQVVSDGSDREAVESAWRCREKPETLNLNPKRIQILSRSVKSMLFQVEQVPGKKLFRCIVNPQKLETGLRTNSAGIPSAITLME